MGSSSDEYPIPTNNPIKKANKLFERLGLKKSSRHVSAEKLKRMHVPHGSILSLPTSSSDRNSASGSFDQERSSVFKSQVPITETESRMGSMKMMLPETTTSSMTLLPLETIMSAGTQEELPVSREALPSINTNLIEDYPILEENSASPQELIRAILQNADLITADTPVVQYPAPILPLSKAPSPVETNVPTQAESSPAPVNDSLNTEHDDEDMPLAFSAPTAPEIIVQHDDTPQQQPERYTSGMEMDKTSLSASVEVEDNSSELYYQAEPEENRPLKRSKSAAKLLGLFRRKSIKDLLRPRHASKTRNTNGSPRQPSLEPPVSIPGTSLERSFDENKRSREIKPQQDIQEQAIIDEAQYPEQQPSFDPQEPVEPAEESRDTLVISSPILTPLNATFPTGEMDPTLADQSQAIVMDENKQDYLFFDMVETSERASVKVKKRKSVGQKLSSFFNKSMAKMKLGLKKKKNSSNDVLAEEREELFSFDEAFRPDSPSSQKETSPGLELDDEFLADGQYGTNGSMAKLPPPYIRPPFDGEEEYQRQTHSNTNVNNSPSKEDEERMYLSSIRKRNSLHSISTASVQSERIRLEGDVPEFDQLDNAPSDRRSLAEKVRSLLQLDDTMPGSIDETDPKETTPVSPAHDDNVQQERLVNVTSYPEADQDVDEDSDPFAEKKPEIAPRKSMSDLRMLRMADEISSAVETPSLPIVPPVISNAAGVTLSRSKSMSSIGSKSSGASKKSYRSGVKSSSNKRISKHISRQENDRPTSPVSKFSADPSGSYGYSSHPSTERSGPYKIYRASRSTTHVGPQKQPVQKGRRPSLQAEIIHPPRGMSPALSSIQDILNDVEEFVHELDPSIALDKVVKRKRPAPLQTITFSPEDVEDGPVSPLKRQGIAVFGFDIQGIDIEAAASPDYDPDTVSVNEVDVINDYFMDGDSASIKSMSKKSRRSSIASSVRSKRARSLSMTLAAANMEMAANETLHSAPVSVDAQKDDDNTSIVEERKATMAVAPVIEMEVQEKDLITEDSSDAFVSKAHSPGKSDSDLPPTTDDITDEKTLDTLDNTDEDDENIPLGRRVSSNTWKTQNSDPLDTIEQVKLDAADEDDGNEEEKRVMDEEYVRKIRKRYSQTSLYSVKNHDGEQSFGLTNGSGAPSPILEHSIPISSVSDEISNSIEPEQKEGTLQAQDPTDVTPENVQDVLEEPEPIVKKLRRKLTWSKSKPQAAQSTSSTTAVTQPNEKVLTPMESRLQERLKKRVLEHVNKPSADGMYAIRSVTANPNPPHIAPAVEKNENSDTSVKQEQVMVNDNAVLTKTMETAPLEQSSSASTSPLLKPIESAPLPQIVISSIEN